MITAKQNYRIGSRSPGSFRLPFASASSIASTAASACPSGSVSIIGARFLDRVATVTILAELGYHSKKDKYNKER